MRLSILRDQRDDIPFPKLNARVHPQMALRRDIAIYDNLQSLFDALYDSGATVKKLSTHRCQLDFAGCSGQ
jgi:hypothetical protein